LSADQTLVKDLSDNDFAPITTGIEIKSFVDDSTAPTVVGFVSANPNTGALTLLFNEPVDTATISYKGLVVRSTKDGKGVRYPLQKDGQVAYANTQLKTEITITIHNDDLQALQGNGDAMFTSTSNTFLVVSANAISDMASQKIASNTTHELKKMIDRDLVTLSSYTLDLAKAVLSMTFDGSVVANKFDPTKLTLSSAPTGTGIELFTLTNASKCTSSNGFTMDIDIGLSDLNDIKALRSLANAATTTYLYFTAEIFEDVLKNAITSIVASKAQKVKQYTKDTKPPTVTAFEVAVDPGTITLTFSETVDFKT
jgi:hypothetical protein